MPYSIQTKDGITIQNIPDDIPRDSQVLKDRVAKIRAENSQPKQPERSTAKGLADAAVRGGGPIAAGAVLGAAAGAPFAGVGAIPGAAAGAGAAALATFVGDPVTRAVNKLFGTSLSTPSEAIGHLMEKAGIGEAETPLERVVQAGAGGAAGASGIAAGAGQLANVAANAGRTNTAAVLGKLAAQPGLQAVSGAGAGTASQVTAENGGGTLAQLAASLAGGLAAPAAVSSAARLASVRNSAIPAEQKAIIDAGKSNNVPVLTSDVLPPESFMSKSLQSVGERIPVAGTGPVRAAQQQAREGSVAAIASQYGKPDYEAIVSSLKGKVGNIKKAAGRVINKAGQNLDTAGPVAPVKTTQAIDDAISKLSRSEVYSPASAPYLQELTDLKATFAGNPTYTNLRESRTALREVMDSVDSVGRSQLPSRTKALFANVYSALKNDMDDFAQANLSQSQLDKLNKANIVYGETAGLLKNTRLKNVLDKGDVKPEVVKSIVFNGQPSEMKTLYESLGTTGRRNVRAAVIDDAASKSVLANGDINPNRFGVELAKADKRLDAFFKGDERDAVKGLTRLLQVTRRGQDAALAPTNGSSAIPYALGAGAIANLAGTLVAGATTGGLARFYESKGVRDMLLKLSNTPRNTPQEGDLLRKLAASAKAAQQQQEAEASRGRPAP